MDLGPLTQKNDDHAEVSAVAEVRHWKLGQRSLVDVVGAERKDGQPAGEEVEEQHVLAQVAREEQLLHGRPEATCVAASTTDEMSEVQVRSRWIGGSHSQGP
jgi:hypothetical protein